jgi:DNA-binding LacI/PurR family transcriptional regulator
MRHLHDRGRTNPVLVTEELESKAIQTRIAAYMATAAECGIIFDESRIIRETEGWLVSDPEYYGRFDELALMITSKLRADSVLCDTDFTAVGLLRAFRRLGIRVPTDISVIGWGDLQFSAVFDPSVTTVSHQLPELLSQVISRLQKQLESTTEAGVVDLVETKLVTRETS